MSLLVPIHFLKELSSFIKENNRFYFYFCDHFELSSRRTKLSNERYTNISHWFTEHLHSLYSFTFRRSFAEFHIILNIIYIPKTIEKLSNVISYSQRFYIFGPIFISADSCYIYGWPNPKGDGKKQPLHARIVSKGTVRTEEIAEDIADVCGYSTAVTKEMLDALAHIVSSHLRREGVIRWKWTS